MAKREFPRVHYYDHDLIDIYDLTWNRIKDFWKKGTEENGFQPRYFNHPGSNRINQFEACLSTFFLVYSNRAFPATALLDNFYGKQEESGAIRGQYREADGRPVASKTNPEGVLPPLFSWAEYNIYHKVGLKKRIRDILLVLERYFQWLERVFKQENGLYSVPLDATLMSNSPRREAHYPVDFNLQQALNALYMSALGDILNDKEVSYRYKKAFFALKTRINSLMWSEPDSFYYDLDRGERQVRVKTLAPFWALLAEIPNEVKAEALIRHLADPREFGLDNPFPSLAASEAQFEPTGQGYRGSVFSSFTYAIIKGLEKYAKFELARECAIKHIYYVLEGLHPEDGKQGTFWEAYAPMGEGPASWPDRSGFPRPMFLPYTALATVAMMIENVVGLYISLPRKTVDWMIPTLEIMGIEDLGLKRNMITILSNKSGRGWEIRLESEKLYYLTINLLDSKKKTLPIPSGKCSILLDKL